MNFTIGGLPKIPHKQFMIIEKKRKKKIRCTQKTTTTQHTCNT